MKIWSNDIWRGHGSLTNGKKYEVLKHLPTSDHTGRVFFFRKDNGGLSFATEIGSAHLISGGKWIIEEDE